MLRGVLPIVAYAAQVSAKGCGDCWCINGDHRCPPPATDYSSNKKLLAGLRQQVALNEYELRCDPYEAPNCTTTPPQDDMFGPDVVCGIIYQTGTCSTYKIQTFASKAAAQAADARILHTTRCGVCSNTQDLAVNLGLVDMASAAYECAARALADPEKGQRCFEEELGFTPPCAKINVLNSINTFKPGNCRNVCAKLMKKGSNVPQVPFNGPPPECKLNDCLQCDEDLSGPHYQGFGGLSRRNAGVAQEIARPCDTIATGITHDTVCPLSDLKNSYSPLAFLTHIAGFGASRAKPAPVKQVRLIGAGLSKTGTTSIKAALKILGYRVYDLEEALPAGHNDALNDVFLGREGAFDRWHQMILDGGFDATLDGPVSLKYAEFFKRSPSAKVLLSVREPEKWFPSYEKTMEAFAPLVGWPFSFLLDLLTFGEIHQASFGCSTTRTWFKPWYMPWVNTVTSTAHSKETCIAGFVEHTRQVKANIPGGSLLEYDVKDGWGPLCKFLGVRVPAEEFPNVNSAADMDTISFASRVIAYTYVLFPVGIFVAFYLVFRCCAGSGGRGAKQKTN